MSAYPPPPRQVWHFEPHDDFDALLAEEMKDPVFARAYGRAEGFHEALTLPLWRRIWRRHAHLGVS